MPHSNRSEPLYRWVMESLRARIEGGAYQTGARLPSMIALQSEFGVSDITIRAALKELAACGLVEARHRSGTFVKATRAQPKSGAADERMIAVVMAESGSAFTSAIVRAVEDECRQAGFHIVIVNTQGRREVEAPLLQELSQRVAGLVIMPIIGGDYSIYRELIARGVPFVFVDQHIASLPVASVTTDNVRGGYLATRHLLELGRRKIYFLGQPDATSVEERLQGYKEALKEFGVAFDASLVRSASENAEVSGYLMTRQLLLESGAEPIGVFAINDFFARSSCVAVREAGLRVPQDVAVVGYDDVIAVFSNPALSSVRQDLKRMGQKAARLLLEELQGKLDARADENALCENGKAGAKKQRVRLQPELIVRDSSDEGSDFSLARHIESRANDAQKARGEATANLI